MNIRVIGVFVGVVCWGLGFGCDNECAHVSKDFNYGVGSGNAGGQGVVQQPAYPNGGQGGGNN